MEKIINYLIKKYTHRQLLRLFGFWSLFIGVVILAGLILPLGLNLTNSVFEISYCLYITPFILILTIMVVLNVIAISIYMKGNNNGVGF